MTIYYFAIIGSAGALGIMKKVFGKINILNTLGYQAEGVFLFHSEVKTSELGSNIHFLYYNKRSPEECYLRIKEFIKTRVGSKDKIIIRYPLANKNLLSLVKEFPNRIWFEHNTKEIEELKNNFKKLTFRDWLYILSRFYITDVKENWKFLKNEYTYFKHIIPLAAGGIGVTNEICEYETKRSNGSYTCKLVGNGIIVENINKKIHMPFDKKNLNLIMMCTTANDWHGTDRLIEGLRQYNGETNIKITLVGNFTSKVKSLINKYKLNERIILLPLKHDAELNTLLNNAHIGIGSLGMHRMGLKEGSVLKVKEYMAIGMPFIIGHEEIDLINKPEFEPFYFKAPANNTPIDLVALVDFAKSVFSIENLEDKIRNFALENIDMKVKMRELVSAVIE